MASMLLCQMTAERNGLRCSLGVHAVVLHMLEGEARWSNDGLTICHGGFLVLLVGSGSYLRASLPEP